MTSVGPAIDAPPAGHYRIEPDASEIALAAKHLFGLATVRGQVSVVSGELVVSDDLSASRATVTAAAAASFDSGDRRRDHAVTAPRFLDAQRFPSFESPRRKSPTRTGTG